MSAIVSDTEHAEPAPVTEQPRRLGGLLWERDFRLLWMGETTSKFGSAITGIALPLVAVIVLHAGPMAMGILTAASWVPWLLIGLPAGAWVDRWPRRQVMVVCNSAAMLLLLSVPIAYWLGILSISYLLMVALASGVSAVFFTPAYGAYLPSIVATKDLNEGNAKLAGSAQVAFIGGSGVGGLIAQVFGAVTGVLLDALTYLVAVVCALSIKTKEKRPERSTERTSLRQEIAEGVRFMMADPYLRIIALCASLENLLLSGAHALLIVFLVHDVGVHSGAIGALMVADSVGGLLGAVLATAVSRRIGTARALLALSIGTAPFGLLIPLTTPGAGIVFFAVGLGVPAAGMVACGIISRTFRQAYCPQELQGRVTTTAMVLVYGSMPVGAVLAGTLGATIGVQQTLWIMLACLAAAKLLRLIGPIKTHRDLPTEPASASRTFR